MHGGPSEWLDVAHFEEWEKKKGGTVGATSKDWFGAFIARPIMW